MTSQHQRNRGQSIMLAAVIAVVGSLFMFDRLGSLMHGGLMKTGALALQAVLHPGPVLLIAAGLCLFAAEEGTAGRSVSADIPHQSREGRGYGK